MELLQLRYFLEVAHSQHITRSAEKLHIAQPSLSQAIKRLEAELGVPLFVARGRNIVLTEYGYFLKEKLEPLIQRLDALPEQMRQMADPERTTIRLKVSAASIIVSEAIIEYRQKHEKVGFQFLLGEDEHLFDLSIESRPTNEQTEPEADCFVVDENICLAVPDDPRFHGLTQVRLKDFREANFISLYSQKRFRQACDRFCHEAGFAPHIYFESDSATTVRNMISAHMGVGFWPAFSWGRPVDQGMRLLEISQPRCRRRIAIQLQKNRVDSRIVEHFYHFLCAFFTRRMVETHSRDNHKC